MQGFGASGGKVLKALAGGRIIHALRTTRGDGFRCCSAFTELRRTIRLLQVDCGVKPSHSAQ